MTAETTTAVEAGSTPRQPWVLPGWGIAVVCVLVALAAAAATVAAGVNDGWRALAHPVPFVVLGLLLVYTHVRPTRLVHRLGSVDSDYLDEAVFVPMVLMLTSTEVALATAVASLASNLIARRAPVKVVFNVGQSVLASLAGYAVARAGGAGSGHPITALALAASCAGGLVFTASTSLAVAGIVRLAVGHPWLRGVWEQWRARGVGSAGALLLGVIAGVAVHDHPITALPAIALAWTVEQAYAAVLVQRQARLAAEDLQRAVVAVRNSGEPERVRQQLVDEAGTVLHARRSALVDPASQAPHGALRVPIDDATALEVADRIGAGSWLESERHALSTLATVGGAALRNARLLAHLTAITDGQTEGVLAIDALGMVTFANPAARRLLAQPDLVGRPASHALTIERSVGPLDLAALAGNHSGMRDDDALLLAGDKRVPIAFTAAGLPAPQTGVVVVLHDITERKALEDRLTYLAFHDPLTDLPNRRLFEDRLDHALIRAKRHHLRHALLMIDLDRFKLVNDSLGHPAGDDLLVDVAALLRASVRPEDTCARLGGDEFGVLIEDVSDAEQAVAVAEGILAGLARGFAVDGHEVFVSASIGIATSDQAPSRETLVAAADAAAYEAKAAGKSRYRVFALHSTEDPRARLELEASLRRALDHEELEVYYQPLAETGSGTIIGAEALVRWNTEDGVVLPHQFIPLAEETGLVVPLGAWVLEAACRQGQAWNAANPARPLKISVNLSAQQLSRPTILTDIAEILDRTGLPPSQLCLEITETVIMSDAESSTATLAALKKLGIQVAIDDFGTGYSSLSYLKRFPVDIVKIDRAFTSGLGENAVDSEIVAAVVRLAAACGIAVVAEGVETPAQRQALAALGCPLIQGYLIDRPLTAAAFSERWVENPVGAAR